MSNWCATWLALTVLEKWFHYHQYHLCVTSQYSLFTVVKRTIGDALDKLTQYYRSNSLRANPDKTQVIAFHLRNRGKTTTKSGMEQDRTAEYPHPNYLGVTLYRTLGYKQHIHKTKMKVATRNNLLRRRHLKNNMASLRSKYKITVLRMIYNKKHI